MITGPQVREPQQLRSRRSFDRALDAAIALLVEYGDASFTLADVARTSGVSTGAIYGRVASKMDLLRAAHAREMSRLTTELDDLFAAAPPGADEVTAVRFAVGTLADHLRRNASVLSPFMLLGITDEVISAGGKATHQHMTAHFERVLLEASPGRRDRRRRRAVAWSCTVAYSVLARQFAVGVDPEAADPADVGQLVDELSRMITAYLRS